MSQKQDREQLVYRLLYGEDLLEIRGELYKLLNPSPKVMVLANRVYEQTIRKCRFEPWLKEREVLGILVKNGFVSPDIDNNLKEITKRIDDLKVELYQSMFRTDQYDKTRKMLDAVKNKHLEMNQSRHCLDYLTLKGYAESVRREYITFSTLYHYETDTRVWDSWENVDTKLMESVLFEAVNHIITISELRDAARNDPWRSYWTTSKGRPFSVPSSQLSDDQRAVIQFSMMYENAQKHPECPPDDVIEDDDLFDGWMIQERRKREKDQMTKQVDNRLGGRHEKADEVYVVAQGRTEEKRKEDVERIHGMNDIRGSIVKKQRAAQLKRTGELRDAQFADRKLEIQQELNQKFIEQVKRK
jgi:hypothetical protein